MIIGISRLSEVSETLSRVTSRNSHNIYIYSMNVISSTGAKQSKTHHDIILFIRMCSQLYCCKQFGSARNEPI